MSASETERPGEAQSASNDAEITRRGRPFEKGNTAGKGRPAGSRNQASLALDMLAEDDAPAILKTVIEAAKGGDLTAAALLLARLWPPRRSRPVHLELPAVVTAEDVGEALTAVVEAMAAGQITPDEAGAVSGTLLSRLKIIEIEDHERRLAALEEASVHVRDAASDEGPAHL